MKTIKVVYERDRVLIDENNEIITYQMLPEYVSSIMNLGMNGYNMSYYQEIHDSYFASIDMEEIEKYKNTSFYEDSEKVFNEYRLVTASELKKLFPEKKVLFENSNQYYDFSLDEEGFSEIPTDFDIASVILFKGEKRLKIMFDYEATGVWDFEGKCISLEWIPCSQVTRDLISQFQQGLNRMRTNYDDDYTEEEDQEVEKYMTLGMKAAIELKKELPEWTIEFYNYDSYFDLPINEYNCSEITSDLKVKV